MGEKNSHVVKRPEPAIVPVAKVVQDVQRLSSRLQRRRLPDATVTVMVVGVQVFNFKLCMVTDQVLHPSPPFITPILFRVWRIDCSRRNSQQTPAILLCDSYREFFERSNSLTFPSCQLLSLELQVECTSQCFQATGDNPDFTHQLSSHLWDQKVAAMNPPRPILWFHFSELITHN
jgi:hypothetical protein